MRTVAGLGFVVMLTAVLAGGVCLGYEDDGFQWWTSAEASAE